jgi:hypothetical protein
MAQAEKSPERGASPLIAAPLKMTERERERARQEADRLGVSLSEYHRRAVQKAMGFADDDTGRRRRRYASAPEGEVDSAR